MRKFIPRLWGLSFLRRISTGSSPPPLDCTLRNLALQGMDGRVSEFTSSSTDSPPPPGGEISHMEGPDSDKKLVALVENVTDNFLLRVPLPKSQHERRRIATQQTEEEELQHDEDNLFKEMMRMKYKELQRKRKQEGLSKVASRYATSQRSKVVAEAAESLAVSEDSVAARAEEQKSSFIEPGLLDVEDQQALRRLKYQVLTLQKQLQGQQGESKRSSGSVSPGTERWDFLDSLRKRLSPG
eukprot:RCo029233